MRNSLLVILYFFSLCALHAQDSSSDKEEEAARTRLNKLFQEEFSRVITGSALAIPGNYAGLSTDKKQISASMFFPMKPDRILNIAVSGGAIGNITEIFDEGKLNSEVSISASYHFIIHTKDEYKSRNLTDDRLVLNKIDQLNKKYNRDILEISSKKTFIEAQAKAAKLDKAITTDKQSLNSLKGKLIAAKTDDQKKKLQDAIDVINSRLQLNIYDRDLALEVKGDDMSIARIILDKEREKNNALKKLEAVRKKERLNGVNMSWISFGYGATNSSFKLFDPEEDIASQITSKDYTTQTATLSINRLKTADIIWKNNGQRKTLRDIKPHGTEFTSVGVNFKYTDNLSSLSKTEVVDTKLVSEDPLRESVTRQNVFSGDYQNDLSELTAFIDYYNYFDEDNSFALHLNPQYKFRENHKPVAQFRVGILIPFKKIDKPGSVVNLEIFYKIKDVFNTTDNDNALLNRNVIGLQASFPFALKR